jgi:DHA2 family multidrug resistance protein-like MFS transporter
VLTVIYGLKRIAQDGAGAIAIVFVILGVGIGTAFVRRQLKLGDPLIDLRLFHIPAFRSSLVMYGGCILVSYGGFLFMPQYLQLVLGLSPLRGGLWTLPWAIGFVVGSLATPPLARRIRPAWIMSCGLVLSATGYFLVTLIGTAASSLPLFAAANFIISLGSAPLFTLTNDIIIGSAPAERAGAASGVSETCAELGGALGIAIFGSIGVMIYRGMLVQSLPTGISPDVTRVALSTLGGAVAVSQQLPAQLGASILDAARDAFLRGLVLCAAISGLGSLGFAVFAARSFRRAGLLPRHTAEHEVGVVA